MLLRWNQRRSRGPVPRLGADVDHNPTRKILDWRLMIEDW
jgi:hypothetical protein